MWAPYSGWEHSLYLAGLLDSLLYLEPVSTQMDVSVKESKSKESKAVPVTSHPSAVTTALPEHQSNKASVSGQLPTPIANNDVLACERLYQKKQYQACYNLAKPLLAKTPSNISLQISVAKVLIKLKKHTQALALLNTQIHKNTTTALTYDTLAILYDELDQLDEAIVYALKAIDIQPQQGNLHCNLGTLYYKVGEFELALQHYQQGAALGEVHRARFAMGLCFLAMRRYQQGWENYEARVFVPGLGLGLSQLEIPIWNGKTTLHGKCLWISWEQGVGDNLQFLRFIPLLKQRFHPTILLTCGDSIRALCENIEGIDVIFTHTPTDMSTIDYQARLLSLPYLLNIHHESEFFLQPYIHAQKNLIEQWQSYIANTKHRIGLCWQGRADYSLSAKRDCPLLCFLTLLTDTRLTLVSLQHGLTPEDKAILDGTDILLLGDKLKDFSDTAAVIANLDLVITVDTAVAHLAGAMGKPVWVLIRYETEWRYPRDCSTSPWYPSMRIFRQTKPGDWASIFREVHCALAELP